MDITEFFDLPRDEQVRVMAETFGDQEYLPLPTSDGYEGQREVVQPDADVLPLPKMDFKASNASRPSPRMARVPDRTVVNVPVLDDDDEVPLPTYPGNPWACDIC